MWYTAVEKGSKKMRRMFFTSLVDGRVYGGGEAGCGEADRGLEIG